MTLGMGEGEMSLVLKDHLFEYTEPLPGSPNNAGLSSSPLLPLPYPQLWGSDLWSGPDPTLPVPQLLWMMAQKANRFPPSNLTRTIWALWMLRVS